MKDRRVFEIEKVQPPERAGFPSAHLPARCTLSDLLIYASVIAGIIALYRLRRTYSQHVAQGDFIPAIQGSEITRWLGIASPLLLPLVFLTAWLWLWLQAHR